MVLWSLAGRERERREGEDIWWYLSIIHFILTVAKFNLCQSEWEVSPRRWMHRYTLNSYGKQDGLWRIRIIIIIIKNTKHKSNGETQAVRSAKHIKWRQTVKGLPWLGYDLQQLCVHRFPVQWAIHSLYCGLDGLCFFRIEGLKTEGSVPWGKLRFVIFGSINKIDLTSSLYPCCCVLRFQQWLCSVRNNGRDLLDRLPQHLVQISACHRRGKLLTLLIFLQRRHLWFWLICLQLWFMTKYPQNKWHYYQFHVIAYLRTICL